MNPRQLTPGPDGDEHRDLLCWTRMQSEAGQALNQIVTRKEVERRAGSGLFFWGVGNAPGTLPHQLAAAATYPAVVFSVMKTAPKRRDVSPTAIVVWRAFVDQDGTAKPLPRHALVTSGTGPDGPARRYALVCRSEAPLRVGDLGPFDPSGYRNLGGAGRPVGASQVTALLRRVSPGGADHYRINMVARLTMGMWVRLADPARVPADHLAELDRVHLDMTTAAWLELTARVRRDAPEPQKGGRVQAVFDFAPSDGYSRRRPALAAT